MKRINHPCPSAACILFVLLCAILLACTPTARADDTSVLQKYLKKDFTMQDLFDAAGKALDKGADPETVLEAMSAAANDLDALDYLNCAVENVMSGENPDTPELVRITENRRLRVETIADYTYIRKPYFGIYNTPSATDAVKSMLAHVKGNACLEPAYWTESDFPEVFGVKLEKYIPAEPRPGYVCVVIRDKSESAPEQGWKGDPENLTDVLEHLLDDLMDVLGDDQPVLTGNPQLASSFWIIELKYPFRGRYGEEGKIRGYNISFTLTVQNAANHKKTADLQYTEILPDRISSWNNWIAKAKLPGLYSSDAYRAQCEKWAGTVRLQLQQERSSAVSSSRITALNAEKILNALLLSQTEKMSDAWQKAIYVSGARNIRIEDNTLRFSLRGYDPKLKELGNRVKSEDPEKWLLKALNNAQEYNLEISVPMEDGTISRKGLSLLRSAVQKAASSAKSSFSGKDMTSALKEALFPVPYEGQLKDAALLREPTTAFTDWYRRNRVLPGEDVPDAVAAAAFALRKIQNINLQGGPHAVTLTCVGGSLNDLVSGSISAITDTQAYLPASGRTAVSKPDEALLCSLLDSVVSAAKKANAKSIITLDLDHLTEQTLPVEYRQLFADFRWEEAVEKLSDTLSSLPEQAALTMPKNGILSGANRGTTVIFRSGAQVWPTYLIMRDTTTQKIAVSAMLHPKKSVTLHVPQGHYEIAWCSGPYWYGTETLFGSLGQYNKSETVEILSQKYQHTYTLITTQQEGVSVYSANPSDFR